MRIVAGQWRGRRLEPPRDRRVRPTPDRVREAWMSILGSELPGARVVDLFAGSGALGLEALSRGAASAEFVELTPAGVELIRRNARELGAGDRAVVRRGDAIRHAAGLPEGAFDIAFADPPYATGMMERLVELWKERPFARILAVEHASKEQVPVGGDTRRYGDTAITFYRMADD